MKPATLVLLGAMAVALIAMSAWCATRGPTTKPQAGPSEAEVRQQMADEAQVADAAMNRVYRAFLKGLDAEGQAKLRAAQRAWLKFRDAQCEFDADAARGGTLACNIHIATFHAMTITRTAELRDANKYRRL